MVSSSECSIFVPMKTEQPAKHSRRSFIRNISFGSAFLLTGKMQSLSAAEVAYARKRSILRFAVASDIHYGQKTTPFELTTDTMIKQINRFHENSPLDFCVLNGDLIHNEKAFMPLVKQQTDKLKVPYFVSRGNHDQVSDAEWKAVWNVNLNHQHVIKQTPILIGDTSNENGDYLSADIPWFTQQLEAHKDSPHVFIFLHIPQAKWTKNAVDTPAFFTLIRQYPNVRAVFHGHEHDQDGVYMDGKLPFFFDSHVGGDWGLDYKGFRVVELLDDGTLITYMMNPVEKRNEWKSA